MTPFSLILIRIALGSGMFILGVSDFRRANKTNPTNFLDAIDEQMLGRYSEEVRAGIRKATAAVLMASGLLVCLTIFFTGS